MEKQCECKLPYVKAGTDKCTECGNQQTMFLPIKEKQLSVKRDFDGSEFKRGDIVEVIRETHCCLVEIQNYIHGFYRVKVPNGCFTETQFLGNKITPQEGERK